MSWLKDKLTTEEREKLEKRWAQVDWAILVVMLLGVCWMLSGCEEGGGEEGRKAVIEVVTCVVQGTHGECAK